MSCVIGSWTGARSFLTWLGLEGYSDSVLRTPYPYSIGNASHLGEKSVQRFQGYHGKARIIWDIIPRPTSTSKVGTVYLLFDHRGNCCEWPQYGFFSRLGAFSFFPFSFTFSSVHSPLFTAVQAARWVFIPRTSRSCIPPCPICLADFDFGSVVPRLWHR